MGVFDSKEAPWMELKRCCCGGADAGLPVCGPQRSALRWALPRESAGGPGILMNLSC